MHNLEDFKGKLGIRDKQTAFRGLRLINIASEGTKLE